MTSGLTAIKPLQLVGRSVGWLASTTGVEKKRDNLLPRAVLQHPFPPPHRLAGRNMMPINHTGIAELDTYHGSSGFYCCLQKFLSVIGSLLLLTMT